MISEKNDCFFAASNGFDGFKSNFDKVFSPSEFKRIYVLKGCPGTGKSTLMRKISNDFSGFTDITNILCSSDISSLDGVIINKGNVKIGIVDGTSPHVVEPKYPGAVERIIDLGEGFDLDSLSDQKDKIIELCKRKSKAYENAYILLRAAGEIYNSIYNKYSDYIIKDKAEEIIKDITFSKNNNDKAITNSSYLLSSFSKDGYKTLSVDRAKKNVITIKGDGISEHYLLRLIKEKNNINASFTVYCSPFSSYIYDAIETASEIYCISDQTKCDIDSSIMVNSDVEYLKLMNCYRSLLSSSQDYFALASKNHAQLEKIYSSNISFDNNNTKYSDIRNEIRDILSKEI